MEFTGFGGGTDISCLYAIGLTGFCGDTTIAGVAVTGFNALDAPIFLASLGFLGTPLANNPPNPPGEGPDEEIFSDVLGFTENLHCDTKFQLENILGADELLELFVEPPTIGADRSLVTAFFSFIPVCISLNN